MKLFWIYLAIINLYAFCQYGWDKHLAKKKKFRIPERELMLAAGLGGALGALLGMQCFRHKTQHKKFTIGVPLLLALWILIIGVVLYFFEYGVVVL